MVYGVNIYPDIYKEINSAVHFLKFKAIKQITYGFNNTILHAGKLSNYRKKYDSSFMNIKNNLIHIMIYFYLITVLSREISVMIGE